MLTKVSDFLFCENIKNKKTCKILQTVCDIRQIAYVCVMTQTERSRLYNIIGERICKIRQAKGYSQQEFSIKLRISRASVVNIEKGRQHAPLHLLWLIADVLDTQIHYLIPLQEELKGKLDNSSLRQQVRDQVGNNEEVENRVVEFVQSVYAK